MTDERWRSTAPTAKQPSVRYRVLRSVIPRLHDQGDIEQSSSKHPAKAFKIHVHDVCSNCSMFA